MRVKEPPDRSGLMTCRMPGLPAQLHVAPGQRVDAGQTLAAVEAMTVENDLRAVKAGPVGAVHAKVGDRLTVDAVVPTFR